MNLKKSLQNDLSVKKTASVFYRMSEADFTCLVSLFSYYCYLDGVGFASQGATLLEDPIITTVLSESYLLSEHDVLTRNLVFLPALKRIGVSFQKGSGYLASLVHPPLATILLSLSDEERESLFDDMHPASRAARAELSSTDHKWLQENRQTLVSYRTIIFELTGEEAADFETSNPVQLLKVLYLLVSTNQSYALSVKPLLKSLENKPHQPMFDNAYDIPYALTIAESGERAKNNRFLNTRDKNNPNLTKAVLNELLCYLLDACKPNKARLMRVLPAQVQLIKQDLQALLDRGCSEEIVIKKAEIKLERLFSPFSSFNPGESLFEKMSLAMIVKDIANQLVSEKEVLCIASSCYFEHQPSFNDYQSQIRRNPILNRIFENSHDLQNLDIGISRKQSSDSLAHRRILAMAGLHHYLKSAGFLSSEVVFDVKDMEVILLIVFDESIQKTKVPFTKNIPSSDSLGSESSWNSLLNYSKEVLFTSDTTPNATASQCMPYMHQLFWKERYQQVFRLLNTPDSYKRYVSSKQAMLTHFIDWLDNEILPVPPKRG
ncbi:hypothetical protein [Vibrio crassostreae]|uniref:hypothetical protein n=1 Tax=Vibrio crassostreae TaxID=246167 RepID=UPI00106421E8|nr:hypothetical protein [Vibrio crassostreae]